MTNIAEAPSPTHIVFGTDGWRARVADEYTFENVRRCADGVAAYVVARGEQAKGVVIAYDRRFASEHFAVAAAEVLLAHDIPVAYASHAVPTQMSSYEVVERGSAAGIVITASHNPWTDNGFKVKSPSGSAAGPEILKILEARIAVNGGTAIERRPFADAEAAGLVERYDPYEGYEKFLRRTIDLDALKGADAHILVEPMWGAGAGWLSRLLAGGRIRVTEIHQERNPYFGGVNPEPIRPHIDEALGMLAGGGYDLGLMLDGDADRAGAADERGTFIHQLEVTGPAHVLPGRAPRAARPGRHERQQHLDDRPAREALRHQGLRDLGRVQVHRAQDDRDRRDDGWRGIRRVRIRDAPARARRGLRRPPAARPVPARAGGRALAGLEGARALPRDRRAVVLPADRRPRRQGRLPRGQDAPAGRPDASTRRRRSPASRSSGPRPSTPATARSSSWPMARGCSSGRAARSRSSGSTRRPRRRTSATPWSPTANAWSARHDRGRGATGREALGLRAHLVADRPVRRQDPVHRRGPPAVAPEAPRQGRSRSSSCAAGCACISRARTGSSGRPTSSPGRTATSPSAGSTGTRRSTRTWSSSRSRPPSSTTSSASRMTSGGPAPALPDRSAIPVRPRCPGAHLPAGGSVGGRIGG